MAETRLVLDLRLPSRRFRRARAENVSMALGMQRYINSQRNERHPHLLLSSLSLCIAKCGPVAVCWVTSSSLQVQASHCRSHLLDLWSRRHPRCQRHQGGRGSRCHRQALRIVSDQPCTSLHAHVSARRRSRRKSSARCTLESRSTLNTPSSPPTT